MLGKVLTAKALAVVGALALTGGVASAATGSLPDPAQDAASNAVSHVGLHIPKSDASEHADHPDNHGKDVSTVAHDTSTTGADHGAAVCAVASEGKCQAGDDDGTDTTDTTEGPDQGKSADHRQDGEHRNEHSVTAPNGSTSTTEVTDDESGDSPEDHPSGQNHPSGSDHPSGESGHDGGQD